MMSSPPDLGSHRVKHKRITYHAVDSSDAKTRDHDLCKKAVSVYKRQRKKHAKARLLVRAEGVTESAQLLKLYRDAGLAAEEVNYTKTLEENTQALNGLRNGSLDAVVCIDQIGEGRQHQQSHTALLEAGLLVFAAKGLFQQRRQGPDPGLFL